MLELLQSGGHTPVVRCPFERGMCGLLFLLSSPSPGSPQSEIAPDEAEVAEYVIWSQVYGSPQFIPAGTELHAASIEDLAAV